MERQYFYLYSFYFPNGKFFWVSGDEFFSHRPKNSSFETEECQVYLDWYPSNQSMIADIKLMSQNSIRGIKRLFYQKISRDTAKECFSSNEKICFVPAPKSKGKFFRIESYKPHCFGFETYMERMKQTYDITDDDFMFLAPIRKDLKDLCC